ncbi:MAG: helicase HerA-like domain-containing protein [Bacteroidota bacterium]
MSNNAETFKTLINEKYQFEGDSIILGGAMLDGEAITNAFVEAPLKTLNRHGLIAGATGTGKTKTLQIIAEQLSAKGIPSMLMDIKGDLSGIAVPSDGHPKIDERHEKIGFPFEAGASPVEFLSLSGEKGLRLRATVTEFGATLFSKILNLNDTQSGIVAVVFKYCDDNKLPLLDLEDFKKTLQYITNEGKEEAQKEYGRISSASVGAITRKILELEQQGAGLFFGEPSFDVNDLVRTQDGKGIISILRLTDIQDRPKLFSTFMLQLLAEVYATFPETGDDDKPKLILFIDEAHLVFEEASSVLLDQLEAIIKLIRSKGVGIFFITQNPADIPEDVLGQLGMKVQHALRAFTAKDRKAIKLAAQNFPISDYYEIDELLTQMGIGEAFVTVLNEKGIPTPLAHTLLRAPQSRMDILTDTEIKNIIKVSELYDKYSKDVDRESAHEILSKKIEAAHEEEHQEELKKQKAKGRKSSSRSRKEKSTFEEILDSRASREITRTISRELTRGLLGALGIKTTSRRRKSSWF